ncbi:hypothetical protein HPB49_019998 [Dermacentor silvarum]|uniref:Uncharacterized protein n=1 Tax=Dermacentor silvarum TaxID=543639 RepID=A0ACB8C542_DERSI|nr:hypothetical protein HPB49_019998 [Dermacentor silvarum]
MTHTPQHFRNVARVILKSSARAGPERSGIVLRRRIVESEYQHVVYNEFLPAVLGDQFIAANGLSPPASGFTQYDNTVDATSINEFANTAFRFMHSNIDGTFIRFGPSGEVLPPVLLEREYFEMFDFSAIESSLLRGMLLQPVRKFSRLGDRAVTQMLFRLPESPFGLDLFAIDIERGRDHGTASYAAYVERLFGITLTSFDDLHERNLMSREVAKLYADIYEPSAAAPPRSPDEEVFVPDVSSSSVPSTGLLRVTTSMPTMQQQCTTDSSKTQDATSKDSPLRDVNVNLSAIVPTDTGDPMDVQPSGGSTNAAKRGPPVNVLQQDVIASEQPAKKVFDCDDLNCVDCLGFIDRSAAKRAANVQAFGESLL